MSSLDLINYSLRQNKVIQRRLVFDCCKQLINLTGSENSTFIGFGSIWFPDFQIAHTELKISKLISLESKPIEFERARYNKPFGCIEVINGHSSHELPKLVQRKDLLKGPWIVWLDYCSMLREAQLDDLVILIEKAPENSIILTTYNADIKSYGNDATKAYDYFSSLFGSTLTGSLTKRDFDKKLIAQTSSDLLGDSLVSASVTAGRDNFSQAIQVDYRDSIQMATVGGIITSDSTAAQVDDLISSPDWEGRPSVSIAIPPLTMKEVAALKSVLPSPDSEKLDAAKVQELGFELNDSCLQVFEKYYKYYPSFAQVGM